MLIHSQVLVYLFYDATYNLYFSPLSQYPGPKLWAISKVPSQLSVLSGHTHLDITALHERYGTIVRIGPNELAINTPQAYRDIYSSRNFKKDPNHYMVPPNGVNHLVCAVDDAVHARHRRLLAYAFSDRALREQESLIIWYVDMMIQKLKSVVDESSGGKVDMKTWINYATFDITGDLMFGESFKCLEESRLHEWIAFVFSAIKLMAIRMVPNKIKQQALDHFNMGAAKVDRRLKMGTDRPDFISAVLKNGFSEEDGGYQENEKILSRAEVHSNAFILIMAGSETSATMLSGCVYYLCKSASAMQKITSEIREAFATQEEIKFANAATLPYLAAVIEESLRMYPPVVTSLKRVSPVGGATVDGHFIPENTLLACHHYASYHSRSNFVRPNEFIPERWLGTNSRFMLDNKDILQPFSLGPRGCLGKNLAYAEIRMILCKLLFHFDIELCPESHRWADQNVYYVWEKPALMVKLNKRPGEF
ncbi:cytochrome P450 family protein [Stipitochalara longipes BDJ]|nr:cytochrome P450 family protein [Stipitochalara longipes BDJ]